MKQKTNFLLIMFCCLLILLSRITFHQSEKYNDIQTIKVDDTLQRFPIRLDNTYEIISASIEEDLLVISLKNRKTSEVYLSSLSYNELEDFVCNVQFYTYKGKNIHYNCSTKEKTVYSMIKEVGFQAVEMIKEGK